MKSTVDVKQIFIRIALLAMAMTLPGVEWFLFCWMLPFFPVLLSFVLLDQGFYSGNRIVLISSVLGCLCSLLFGSKVIFIFALSLIPVGYVLAHSMQHQKAPVMACAKASGLLSIIWAVLLSGILFPDVSPYKVLLASTSAMIDAAIEVYTSSGSLSLDERAMIKDALVQSKSVIPLVMPSVLVSFAISTVWCSATATMWLMKVRSKKELWPKVRYWQLPDTLIWGVIIMAALAFLPIGSLSYIGINFLIILATIYNFHGLSIVVFLMDKWNIPRFFRAVMYVMLVLQTFGTIILLFFGIADTWLNFRKLPSKKEETK